MKMRKGIRCFSVVAGMLCWAGAVKATTVPIGADTTGTALKVFGITSNATTGNDMAGLSVVVHLCTLCNGTDNTVDTRTWVALGGTSGQATSPNGWTLSETGDTGTVANTSNPDGSGAFPWTLTNTSITQRITSVDLLTGTSKVVFDRDQVTGGGAATGGQTGSGGSIGGITFAITSTVAHPADTGPNTPYVLTASYTGIVQFFTSTPCVGSAFTGLTTGAGCGDLWQQVTFSFNNSNPFIGANGNPATFHFYQDTDMEGAPEPVSMALMGIGLLALVGYRRHYNARQSH